jgi:cytochrome c oxidase subunit 4
MSDMSLGHGRPTAPAAPAPASAGEYGYARVAGEHAHPNALRYVQIATVLAVLTAFEVAVYYSRELHPVLVPILLTLSACKFALVVLFYMHLKFDSRIFGALFTLGMFIAGSIIVALIVLFRSYFFVG